jgi:hypothetical protein
MMRVAVNVLWCTKPLFFTKRRFYRGVLARSVIQLRTLFTRGT